MKLRLLQLLLALLVILPSGAAYADELVLKSSKGVTFAYDIYQDGAGYRVRLVIRNDNGSRISTDGPFTVYWKDGSSTYMNPTTVRGRSSYSYPSTRYFQHFPVYKSWRSPAWRFR